MNFFRVIKEFYTGNNAFQGRMTRSEFWWFYLWYLVFAYVAGIISGIVQIILYGDIIYELGGVGIIYLAGCFLPFISNSIRRMHDIGRSGWWIIVPIVSWIMCLFPSDGPNQYDLNNKQAERDQKTRRTRRNNPPIERHRNKV